MRRLVPLFIVGLVSCGDASSEYVGYGLGSVSVEDAGVIDEIDAGVVDVIDSGVVSDAGVIDAGTPVSYAHQVAPLLSSRCGSCHSFTYSTNQI